MSDSESDGLDGICPDYGGSSSEDDYGYGAPESAAADTDTDTSACLAPRVGDSVAEEPAMAVVFRVLAAVGIDPEPLAVRCRDAGQLDGVLAYWLEQRIVAAGEDNAAANDGAQAGLLLLAAAVLPGADHGVIGKALAAVEGVAEVSEIVTAPAPIPLAAFGTAALSVPPSCSGGGVGDCGGGDGGGGDCFVDAVDRFRDIGMLVMPGGLRADGIAALKEEALARIEKAEVSSPPFCCVNPPMLPNDRPPPSARPQRERHSRALFCFPGAGGDQGAAQPDRAWGDAVCVHRAQQQRRLSLRPAA